jgi:hypothetical protein
MCVFLTSPHSRSMATGALNLPEYCCTHKFKVNCNWDKVKRICHCPPWPWAGAINKKSRTTYRWKLKIIKVKVRGHRHVSCEFAVINSLTHSSTHTSAVCNPLAAFSAFLMTWMAASFQNQRVCRLSSTIGSPG